MVFLIPMFVLEIPIKSALTNIKIFYLEYFFSGFLMWDSSIDGCSECFRLSLCLTTSNYAEVDIPELVSLAKEESWKQGLLGHRRSK